MTALLVGTAAQERDAAGAGQLSHLGDLSLRLRTAQPCEVPASILVPVDRATAKRAEQLHHGAQLAQPGVHAVLTDAARPEPHDEDSRPIVRRRLVVDALDRDPGAGHWRAPQRAGRGPGWPSHQRRGPSAAKPAEVNAVNASVSRTGPPFQVAISRRRTERSRGGRSVMDCNALTTPGKSTGSKPASGESSRPWPSARTIGRPALKISHACGVLATATRAPSGRLRAKMRPQTLAGSTMFTRT